MHDLWGQGINVNQSRQGALSRTFLSTSIQVGTKLSPRFFHGASSDEAQMVQDIVILSITMISGIMPTFQGE